MGASELGLLMGGASRLGRRGHRLGPQERGNQDIFKGRLTEFSYKGAGPQAASAQEGGARLRLRLGRCVSGGGVKVFHFRGEAGLRPCGAGPRFPASLRWRRDEIDAGGLHGVVVEEAAWGALLGGGSAGTESRCLRGDQLVLSEGDAPF